MREEGCMLTILPPETAEHEDVDKLMLAILPLEEGGDGGPEAED